MFIPGVQGAGERRPLVSRGVEIVHSWCPGGWRFLRCVPSTKKHRHLIIVWVFEEYDTYLCSVRYALQEKSDSNNS